MSSLPIAIGTFEGFDVPGSLAQQNNNPGNLVYSPWESAYGGEANGAGGFASFPDALSGYAALKDRLSQLESQGASISDVVNAWAGPQYPGNTQAIADNYKNFLSQQTGMNPNEPILSQLTPNNSISPDTTVPFFSALNLLGAFGLAPKGVRTNGANAQNSGSVFERIATGIVGMICIAGAIYLFKPTQHIMVNAGKAASTAVSTLAVAG